MKQSSHNSLDMEHRVGGPGFRWKIAHRYAALERALRSQKGDSLIRQAADYLRMCRGGGSESANHKHPHLAAACALAENVQAFQTLKLSILGHLPRAEIAARLGGEQQVIEIAELLFFDVNGVSQASSWMNCHIFAPEAQFGSKEFAAKMRLALSGGPVVTRILLDGQEKLPLGEAQQIIDQELQLHAKLQAALEFDLDAKSAEQFLKVFLAYDLERKKLEFEREKFHVQCALARDQCVDNEAHRESGASGGVPGSQTELPHVDQVLGNCLGRGDGEQLVA